jgi:D-glycero-D-manno-heptose 1,7-bisphosphate phosphatase
MNRPVRRAMFLDRDGVVNVDHGYVHRVEQFVFCEGIFDLVRLARRLGLITVVVTNQAGIGRGYYTEADFQSLSRWMLQEFELRRAQIDRVYYCPDHPEAVVAAYRRDSPMRKPQPGMILQARTELDLSLPESVLIGDKESDIEAGRRAGVGTTILVSDPLNAYALDTRASHVVGSPREALNILQALYGQSS